MNEMAEMIEVLGAHQGLCERLLRILERESQGLCDPLASSTFEFFQSRKELLPELDRSLTRLKAHRPIWEKVPALERQRYPEISRLLRRNQDLTMKVIVLDRENEQALLRRGMVPPNQLPAANRQRPHFVAELYRRNRAC